MAENTKVTSEEVKEEKVETAKTSNTTKKKETKAPKKKKMRTYQQRQNRSGYMFMAPWILGFCAFTLFPFIFTIYLSFTSVASTNWGYKIEFIGLSNYINAFVGNQEFLPALLSYIKMIIPYTFIVVVLSFIIAYLLCKINVGKGILRTIYFLPVIIMSGPVMSQLLTVQNAGDQAAEKIAAVTQQTNAYSNIFIMQIIDSYSPALANGLAGIFDQLSIILWFTGIPIVLFINGLQKINPSIYEAAKIDGASKLKQITAITLPLLRPTIIIMTLMAIGRVFYSDFGLFYQVPMNAGTLFSTTQTIDTYVYRGLMEQGNVGMSSAAGVYQSLVGFALVMIANFIVRKKDPENALF